MCTFSYYGRLEFWDTEKTTRATDVFNPFKFISFFIQYKYSKISSKKFNFDETESFTITLIINIIF